MTNTPQRFDGASVKAAAVGRMTEILAHFGMGTESTDGKNHPCPKCGGTDRFSVFGDFVETGGCQCRKCNPGTADIFATVMWLTGMTFPEAVAAVAEIVGVNTNDKPTGLRKQSLGEPVATYNYHDEEDAFILQVVRYEPKTFRQRQPKPGGGWNWSVKGVPAIPYRLPELLAETKRTVFLCEGEKDAENVRCLGLIATCNAGGAGKWTAEHSKWLKGRNVVLLPHHDDAGEKHVTIAGRTLIEVAESVKVLRLPSLNEKEDASDWIAAGGTKEQLIDLVKAAPDWKPEPPKPKRRQPKVTCLADIDPRPIRWLWPGRIAEGRITVASGKAGLGKSFLTCDMAARVSTGADWPDGSPCPQGSAVFVSMEDDPHDTIRPRLDAHKADVNRIHLLEGVIVSDGEDAGEHVYTLKDVQILETVLEGLNDCRLVVIDPIGSYLGGSTDSYKDNEVRAVLAPVAKLAERFGVAVVIVAHTRKSAAAYADDTVMGSRAFTAIARTVFHLVQDCDDKNRRLLLPGKSNIAAAAKGLAFTIAGEPAAVVWESDPIDMTADEAMAIAGDSGGESSAVQEAVDWLTNTLANGPRLGKEIQDMAKSDGIAIRTLRRAKDQMKVVSGPDTFGGPWVWRLAEEDEEPESASVGQGMTELANHKTLANTGQTVANTGEPAEWGEV